MKSELDLALQLTNAFYKKENKSRRHLNFENDCPKSTPKTEKKKRKCYANKGQIPCCLNNKKNGFRGRLTLQYLTTFLK